MPAEREGSRVRTSTTGSRLTRSSGSARARSGAADQGARAPQSPDGHRAQLADIQRARLVAGAVGAIDELGYGRVTVGHITERSRVSRRTFYELFANREECLVAVLEDTVGLVEQELAGLDLAGLSWRERVRAGLAAILVFCDREPVLARVCVVQALRGGAKVLERREEILARLARAIDAGRRESTRGRECTALTAEGLVGAAFGILYTRLLREEHQSHAELLGELMGMIVLPYLGPAAARREQRRPAAPSRPVPARERIGGQAVESPLKDMPVRLTLRTIRVLEGVAEQPGASNRTIGDYAGISDAGQISKLLARLERVGLLANTGPGHTKGEPNAWRLTPRGERVALDIHVWAPHEREAA